MKKQIVFISLILISLFQLQANESKPLGNPLYSRQNLFIYQTIAGGLIGTMDYLEEDILFKYRFRSKIRHAFSLRTYHMGFGPGIFTDQLEKYHFAFFLGFEYLFKIFNHFSGIFTFIDAGICNLGFAINTGVGIGNHFYNGIILSFTYFYHSLFFSRIDFYFTILKYFSLRGRIGLKIKFNTQQVAIFGFETGVFPGFSTKRNFKMEVGAGFTLNDYFIFRWFVGANVVLNFSF